MMPKQVPVLWKCAPVKRLSDWKFMVRGSDGGPRVVVELKN